MPGIYEVAKLAGVSIATVSRALSGKDVVTDETRKKVEAAASELGYVASHSAYTLATGKNRNIGVVLPAVDRWFFAKILEAVDSDLTENGYDLTLYNLSAGASQREKIFKDFLLRKRVDAVLAISVHPRPKELEQLNKMKKPIIAIGGQVSGARSLSIDDFYAGQLATQHLIALGHTKIANISGPQNSDLEFNQPDKRREGYQSAMKEAGLSILDSWLGVADYTANGAYRAAKQMLGDPRHAPTAIFCNSDEMGFGAILAAKDLGLRVPQDVSVIGIDNHDMSELFGLTTIDQQVREQGLVAAGMLLEVLGEADSVSEINVQQEVIWPVELLVRDSTARPGAASR